MRIGEGNRVKQQFIQDEPGRSLGTVPPSASRFRTVLELAYAQEHPPAVEEMLERIDSAGRDLITRRGLKELKAYREAVRKFLKESVRTAFRVKDERKWDRLGNPRDYKIIQKVNHNLDELTCLVLQTQAPGIEIMAKLDEIRGLLVDLLV